MEKKHTLSGRVAESAKRVLADKKASKSEKSVASSALQQALRAKTKTSKEVAKAAAKILKDPKASKEARSAAASALTQKPKFGAGDVKLDVIYRIFRSATVKGAPKG